MTRWLASLLMLLVGCADDDSGSSTAITVMAPFAPDATIAYRDGDGTWSVKTGSQAPFTFYVNSGTYTVAVACPAKKQVDVYHLGVLDLQTLEFREECRPQVAMISGAFVGNGTGGSAVRWGLDAGYGGATVPEPAYSFSAAMGEHDLLATTGSFNADRLRIMRGVQVATTNLTMNVDFGAPDTISLEPHTVGTSSIVRSVFVTAGGTPISLGVGDTIPIVPATAMSPGDLMVIVISSGQLGARLRWTTHAVRSVSTLAPRVLVDPPQPVVSLVPSGAYVLPQGEWPAQPDAVVYDFHVAQADFGWRLHTSSSVLLGTANVLAVPDLSTVQGWPPNLGFSPGRVVWRATYSVGTSLEQNLRPAPSDEGVIDTIGWGGEVQ